MPDHSVETKTVMTAAVPVELRDRARQRAENEDRSIASVVRQALERYLVTEKDER